jgi:hypothetical protein
MVLEAALLPLLACVQLSDAQARYVANNLSQFSLRQGICAVEQIKPPPIALPENPSDEFIVQHSSRYDIGEVMGALHRIKLRREKAAKGTS